MYPEDLKYNIEHTWLKLEGPSRARVGITQYAQEQLKQVVFIELPDIGYETVHMEPFGVIESVKATNDLYSPVSGKVVEVNEELRQDPGIVNQDPYEAGWMVVIELSNADEVNRLLTASQYKAELKL
jgi:glycine cleavage system H protein